jgi:inner membrane protein YhjD
VTIPLIGKRHEPWDDDALTGTARARRADERGDARAEASRGSAASAREDGGADDLVIVAAEPEGERDHEGPTTETAAETTGGDGDVRDDGAGSGGGVGGLVQKVLRPIDAFQQAHRPVAFAYGVVKKFGDDQAGNLAALVAYYLFFSIFPLLLVFTTVLGFVLAGDPARQQDLLDSALASFPVLGDQIRTNIGTARGSGVALVIGLVGALWGGMGAVAAMQNAMNSIWDVPRRDWPTMVQQRLRSLGMLVGFAVFVAISTVAGGLASGAESWPLVGRVVVLIPAVAVNAVLFLWSFRVLTSTKLSWSTLWPGAVVAGIFFTVIQTVGGVYANHVVQNAGPVYGSFAIVLGLLSLLYLQAQLTVLAAEINVVRANDLYPRSLIADRPTEADNRVLARAAGVEARRPDEGIRVSVDATDVPPSDVPSAAVGARAASARHGN